MLNYFVPIGEFDEDSTPLKEPEDAFKFNPFPGLRPFSINETHLYFGREGQIDEILVKLSKNRSITVLGYSGSGKSSLMSCGLVPVLYGGFMTDTGPYWHILSVRPGTSPITNLINAIVEYRIQNHSIKEEDREIHKVIINSVLRSGQNGLVEVCKYLQNGKNENVFILIDQFEDLFRYHESSSEEASNDAITYVNLILHAIKQKKYPIYLAINLKSDFIKDCSEFAGLTQMVNESNYLIPQMTREQKRMVIEGPVAVGGGRISQRLVKQLLTDISNRQDQLSILQHAMMRTWDYWFTNREPGEPMDVRHYSAIGKIEQALSLHANEAYDELTIDERWIAEILFKNITERSEDNQEMRRPCKISVIAEMAQAGDEEVIKVVESFRKPGRSFLMPDSSVQLTRHSVVELSHESLMRIWGRLAVWVEEESESASIYKRISEAAAIYQIGKTGLWRPPDLQLALNWQKKQKPTRAWAQRYSIAFERAMVFLDTSRITHEAELKNQELLQQRSLRKARITNVILAIFLLIAIAFFFYGLTQQITAEREALNAIAQEELALSARDDAERQRITSEEQTELATERLIQVQQLNDQLGEAVKRASIAQKEAEVNFRDALLQKQIAEMQRGKAEVAIEGFKIQYNRAEVALKKANRLLFLSVAQSMEAKSVGLDDPELSGLLSMQGYLFHARYEGKKYDPYVFSGLYYSLAKLSGLNYNALFVPGNLQNRMYAMAISKTGDTFYTTGNDGRIFKGDFMTQTIEDQIDANPFPNRVLELSIGEKYLVSGSDSSFVNIYNLEDSGRPVRVDGHKGYINAIKFFPDNSGFISSGSDRTIRFTNHESGKSNLLLTIPFELKAIDVSSDGDWMIGGSTSGELALVNLRDHTYEVVMNEAPNRILSVAYHPTRNLIAYGLEVLNDQNIPVRGVVKLYDTKDRRVIKNGLTGHKSGISDLEFSPDGLLLASAGLDKKLQMWVVDHEEDLPILMDNNNGNIWDIVFAKGSDFLIASCNNGEIRIWPTNTRILAEQVCPKLTRNMNYEEWEVYVANGISYERTCKSLLIDDF